MSRLAIDLVRADCAEVFKSRVELLAPLKGEMLTVTGGTGFMGTWLAEAVSYLNDEHRFGMQIVLVSRSSELFSKSYPHLSNRKDIVLVKSDVRHAVEVYESAS